MRYPTLRINGKKIKLDKVTFDWYRNQIKSSISFDNEEYGIGLTKEDIELLSYNCAVFVYHEYKMFG